MHSFIHSSLLRACLYFSLSHTLAFLRSIRLVFAAWRAQHADQRNLAGEWGRFYLKFYGFLIVGLLVLYQMQSFVVYLALLLFSYWVPQIVNNVKQDTRRGLTNEYVVIMSVTRLFLPM